MLPKIPESNKYCYKNIDDVENADKYKIDMAAYITREEKIGSTTREHTLFVSDKYKEYLFYKTQDFNEDGTTRIKKYAYRISPEPTELLKNNLMSRDFKYGDKVDWKTLNDIFNYGPPPMGEPRIKECPN